MKERPPSVTRRQVSAFRLSRQHLLRRAPRDALMTVLADIAGAQAQIASAAKLSLWARVAGVRLTEIDAAIASRRIVRAACMRRTLHLVPAGQVAVFVRGTAKRAERDIRWLLNKGADTVELERVLSAVLDVFSVPLTRRELIEAVAANLGLRPTLSADGWWGSTRSQPSIPIGPVACPPNYLLALAGARGVICYGDDRRNEPTFVRADAWLPDSSDCPVEEAEDALLRSYLGSYGPACPAYFAAWTGIRKSDAEAIWKRSAPGLTPVEAEGDTAWVLASDLDALLRAELARPVVRLLPYFDTYLLGHVRRSFIAPEHYSAVYRRQGWVSPVLLVNGAVAGTWKHAAAGSLLRVSIAPFARLSRTVIRSAEREARFLARFLGCAGVDVAIGTPCF